MIRHGESVYYVASSSDSSIDVFLVWCYWLCLHNAAFPNGIRTLVGERSWL